MRVVVTGGAGFIGTNLVRYLRGKRPEWKLIVADALTYAGNLHNISDLVDNGEIQFEKVDIAEFESIQRLFSENPCDLIFHLAAESHVDRSIHSAAEFVRTNVLGTQNLLDCAREAGVSRFMHISTDEVYGSLGPKGKFLESTPLDPTSPYAASKAASDLLVKAYVKTHGIDAIITRCTNNYGPYQFPEKFIPLFISHALEDKPLPLYGDGMNVRSWIHVDDHCEALLRLSESGAAGEVYNIGGSDEDEIPNIEVARTIVASLNKSKDLIQFVEDRLAHDRRYAVECSKIREAVNWNPNMSFVDGLEKTITWYRTHTDWWQEIKTGEYLDFYEKNYGAR